MHKHLNNVTTLKYSEENCIGCGLCVLVCPHRVFEIQNNKVRIIDRNRCMECGACANNCVAKAITVKAGVGCAAAVIKGWISGAEPSCDCSGDCC